MLHLHAIKKVFKKDYQSTTVLSGVTASFDRLHSYALTGPSGSGKSTLMHIMAGLDIATSGAVLLDERPLSLYSDQERARAIVLITQHPFLIKELSVEENVMVAGRILGLPDNQIQAATQEYLTLVGLHPFKNQSVGSLSGGQRQRVAVARALIVHPQYLCADEITGSLDEKTGNDLILFLKTVCAQQKIGLIISSHNPSVIAHMDLVFALKDGILVSHDSLFTKGAFHERSNHAISA